MRHKSTPFYPTSTIRPRFSGYYIRIPPDAITNPLMQSVKIFRKRGHPNMRTRFCQQTRVLKLKRKGFNTWTERHHEMLRAYVRINSFASSSFVLDTVGENVRFTFAFRASARAKVNHKCYDHARFPSL